MRRAFWIMLVVLTCGFAGAADQAVMFNYQGRVRVNGQPFEGNGQFKFSVVSTSGNATLWSNDSTGTDGNEPTSSITIPVSDGIFNVMIGDPTAGMDTMNSSIFQSQTPLKLRTWFSDGVLGFEQLLPDSNLVNMTLITLNSGETDFTIYVNGASGDDENNGFTPLRAKKTVQGAVRAVPSRLNCNVTIDIADGIYREEVKLNGISCINGKYLTLLGDEAWTPASSGNPAVRITGADVDTPSPAALRGNGLYATQCTGIMLKGILFDYATGSGVTLTNGSYRIEKCKASNNQWGFSATTQADVTYDSALASGNAVHGFGFGRSSYGTLYSCKGIYNGYGGLSCDSNCFAAIHTTGEFSNNGVTGLNVIALSAVGFGGGLVAQFSNNGQYGASIGWNSYVAGLDRAGITVTGNGTGSRWVHDGGAVYP